MSDSTEGTPSASAPAVPRPNKRPDRVKRVVAIVAGALAHYLQCVAAGNITEH
jgi:hypothetical protein